MQVSATAHTSLEPAPPHGFPQLYAEHYDFLWRCAMRMGTPTADLEDVVQECFVVALRRFDTFDPRGRARASTWLFGILRNVQRNHARAARRRSARIELLAQTSSEVQAPGRTAEAGLAGRLLDEFLATLDDDKRAAFVLVEIEGMTGPEIADALELNVNTANSRIRAARQAFARHFDEPNPRRIAEAELERLAAVRAPRLVRRRGLPIVVALAGSESLRSASASASAAAGGIGSNKLIAALMFGTSLTASVAIVATGKPEQGSEPVQHVVTAAPERAPSSSAKPRSEAPIVEAPAEQAAEVIEPHAESRPRVQKPKPTPLQTIASARTALNGGDPARALQLVERQQFPSEYDGHRVALEVAALCRLDRQADAESRARAWRSAHPDHASAAELVGVCWSE